jgi:hypothetical protein
MNTIGRNMKATVGESERGRIRRLYGEIMGAAHSAPMPKMDIFRFPDGFSLGVAYVPDDQALNAAQARLAPWIELLVDDLDAAARALAALGVAPFEYADRTHTYYAGPGGLVFRLAASGA